MKKQFMFAFVLLALVFSAVGTTTPASAAAAPTVVIAAATGQSLTPTSSMINVKVTFGSTIDPASFTAADVTVGNGLAGKPTTTDNQNWNVPILATGAFPLSATTISISANVVKGVVGGANDNSASNALTVVVTDSTSPAATVTLPAGIQPQNGGSTVDFLVTFSEPVAGLGTGDFVTTGTAAPCNVNSVTPVANNLDPLFATAYLVDVDGWICGFNGQTLGLNLTSAYTDAMGNPGTAATGAGFYTINSATAAAPTTPKAPFVPAANALVDVQAPVLFKWGASSQVMALATPWQYEVELSNSPTFADTVPPLPLFYYYNSSTTGDPNALVGLGGNTLTLPASAFVAGVSQNNRTIYWRVRAYSNGGDFNWPYGQLYSSWSATQKFRARLGYPTTFWLTDNVYLFSDTPTGGTWGNISSHRPTIEWDKVPGATSYTIAFFKNGLPTVGGGTVLQPAGAVSVSYTPKVDLPGGGNITFKVKSNGLHAGNFSPASATFVTTSPTAPVLIANNTVSTAPATLTWNASLVPPLPVGSSVAAACYELEIDSSPAPHQFMDWNAFSTYASTVTTATARTFTTPALRPGQTYYWHVRGFTLPGGTCAAPIGSPVYGPWSLIGSLKSKYVAPTNVSPVNTLTLPATNAGGVSRTAPIFTWDMGTNGLWTNVTIQVATNTAFTTGLKSFIVNAPSQTYKANTLLLAQTVYYWRVKIGGLYVGLAPFTNVSPTTNFKTGD